MEFEITLPNWTASGTEPPDALKAAGFQAGYKPPADYFNWFWSTVSACLTEMQEKLANVSETPDTEKHVKFAQEAAQARQTQYQFIIRLNGGRTEGTDQWTFDGSTGRTVNITPAKIGAAEAEHSHTIADVENLQTTLNGKASSSHVHTNYLPKAGGVMSGTLGTKGIALTSDTDYGTSFPTTGLVTGKLFFKKV